LNSPTPPAKDSPSENSLKSVAKIEVVPAVSLNTSKLSIVKKESGDIIEPLSPNLN